MMRSFCHCLIFAFLKQPFITASPSLLANLSMPHFERKDKYPLPNPTKICRACLLFLFKTYRESNSILMVLCLVTLPQIEEFNKKFRGKNFKEFNPYSWIIIWLWLPCLPSNYGFKICLGLAFLYPRES